MLGSNQLSGPIPASLGNLTQLNILSLSSNQLSGAIPVALGNLTYLRQVQLSSNQLSGTIPTVLGSLIHLIEVALSDNLLSGEIPPELGKLTNLRGLTLSSNHLSGTIPSSLGNLAELDWLSLNGNHLSGSLPSSLTVLWLSRFWFDATDLCELGDAAFQSWLGGIGDLRRTDIMCGVRSLSGTVWHDVDGDGSQDPQEPVLRGVTALLSRSSGSLAAIAAGREVVTDGRGIYRFANLAAGAYRLRCSRQRGRCRQTP